jgi:hypothetical protein
MAIEKYPTPLEALRRLKYDAREEAIQAATKAAIAGMQVMPSPHLKGNASALLVSEEVYQELRRRAQKEQPA